MEHRRRSDADHDAPHGPDPAPAPGRLPATARLTPRPQTVVLRVAGGDGAVTPDAEAAVDSARGGSGAALPDDARSRFERSLGADLSSVRVHTDAASADAAHAVGARAYAVGDDIHFAAGQYAPADPFGLHLLAHEVAHTVQQAGGAPHAQYKLAVSSPGDAAEHEADRAADAMVEGAAFAITGAGADVQRDAHPDAKTHEVEWRLGYDRVPGPGATTKGAKPRDASTALYVDTFVLQPGQAGARSRRLGPAVNAKSAGDVVLGRTELPEAPGQASALVRVGSPPGVDVDASVTSERRAARGPRRDKRSESILSRVLRERLKTLDTGDLAEIKAALEEEARAYLYARSTETMHYELESLTIRAHASRVGTGVHVSSPYPAPTGDGVYTAAFVVPELDSGSVTAKETNEQHASDRAEHERSAESSEEITKEDVDKIAHSVTDAIEVALNAAWSHASTQVTRSTSKFSADARAAITSEMFGKLGGKIGVSDLGLPIPAFLKNLPIPGLGAKLSLGVDAEAGVKLSGVLEGRAGASHESSDELTEEEKRAVSAAITHAITTTSNEEVAHRISHKLMSKVVAKHSTSHESGQKGSRERVTVQKLVGSGHPTLTITPSGGGTSR